MYGEPGPDQQVGSWNQHLPHWQEAVEERRRGPDRLLPRLARGCARPGDRAAAPVQTRRGWEVDAGPVGPEGHLRTYLLSNVRELEVLDETFEPPSQLDVRLAEQRMTTTVRMELAQDARWAADMYAEQVDVVREDEEMFEADLELLPPAGERVALLMLASGPSTRVTEHASLLPEAIDAVTELIRHHAE